MRRPRLSYGHPSRQGQSTASGQASTLDRASASQSMVMATSGVDGLVHCCTKAATT